MRARGLTRARRRRPLEWEDAVVETLAPAWRCRLELALLGAAVALERLLASLVGNVGAVIVVLGLVAVLVAVAPARRMLWGALRRASLARSWARAATDSGLADGPFRVPCVLGVARIAAGDVLRVRVLRGQSVLALEARREELAARLQVRDVRVERERRTRPTCAVTLVRRDPFDDVAPIPCTARSWPSARSTATPACGTSGSGRGSSRTSPRRSSRASVPTSSVTARARRRCCAFSRFSGQS
jgi:hypothetical protein